MSENFIKLNTQIPKEIAPCFKPKHSVKRMFHYDEHYLQNSGKVNSIVFSQSQLSLKKDYTQLLTCLTPQKKHFQQNDTVTPVIHQDKNVHNSQSQNRGKSINPLKNISTFNSVDVGSKISSIKIVHKEKSTRELGLSLTEMIDRGTISPQKKRQLTPNKGLDKSWRVLGIHNQNISNKTPSFDRGQKKPNNDSIKLNPITGQGYKRENKQGKKKAPLDENNQPLHQTSKNFIETTTELNLSNVSQSILNYSSQQIRQTNQSNEIHFNVLKGSQKLKPMTFNLRTEVSRNSKKEIYNRLSQKPGRT